jgi:hypothetical protein
MAMHDPVIRGKLLKIGAVLASIVGLLTFMALEFMFFYLVAFACIIAGFSRGNKKGGRG